MTTREIEKRIAVLKGWKQDRDGDWYSPKGVPCKNHPHFCSEWKHAGSLLEEMVDKIGCHKALALVEYQIVSSTATVRKAISRVYLAWKTEEDK